MRTTQTKHGDPHRPAPLPDDVVRVRDQIARLLDPEAIILFGSTLTARRRPDSDIDILVIKRTTKPYFDRVIELRRSVQSSRRLDAIVLTPEEYDAAIKENRYLLVKEILPSGHVIYERPQSTQQTYASGLSGRWMMCAGHVIRSTADSYGRLASAASRLLKRCSKHSS